MHFLQRRNAPRFPFFMFFVLHRKPAFDINNIMGTTHAVVFFLLKRGVFIAKESILVKS